MLTQALRYVSITFATTSACAGSSQKYVTKSLQKLATVGFPSMLYGPRAYVPFLSAGARTSARPVLWVSAKSARVRHCCSHCCFWADIRWLRIVLVWTCLFPTAKVLPSWYGRFGRRIVPPPTLL